MLKASEPVPSRTSTTEVVVPQKTNMSIALLNYINKDIKSSRKRAHDRLMGKLTVSFMSDIVQDVIPSNYAALKFN